MGKLASAVVEAVLRAFPNTDTRPTPKQVEAVMRPFGVISWETEREINLLLLEHGKTALDFRINSWMEANFVVSGSGPMVEERILYLLRDTCTCVLAHLPKAIEHSKGEVDPRIRRLLKK